MSSGRSIWSGLKIPLFLITGTGIALRLIPVVLPSVNFIGVVDIYYADTEACKALLSFHNPYNIVFDPLAGQRDVYAYLPMVPIFLSPFELVFGDVRYGAIFADAVITLACFWVARTFFNQKAIWSSVAFALLPPSIFLTSFIGSNMMIGSMFLLLALAALFQEKYWSFAIIFGLGLATNQLLILAVPFFLRYLWRMKKTRFLAASFITALAIVIPFYLASPSRFLYDVFLFQFQRPLQSNGFMSLYFLTYYATGIELSLIVRSILVLVVGVYFLVFLSKDALKFLASILFFLAVGAVVLPVNGFWSYLLPSMTIACTMLPLALKRPRPLGEEGSYSKKESRYEE
jgi:uncharacterized membrane protein